MTYLLPLPLLIFTLVFEKISISSNYTLKIKISLLFFPQFEGDEKRALKRFDFSLGKKSQ